VYVQCSGYICFGYKLLRNVVIDKIPHLRILFAPGETLFFIVFCYNSRFLSCSTMDLTIKKIYGVCAAIFLKASASEWFKLNDEIVSLMK
jgi:hypothetical protein